MPSGQFTGPAYPRQTPLQRKFARSEMVRLFSELQPRKPV